MTDYTSRVRRGPARALVVCVALIVMLAASAFSEFRSSVAGAAAAPADFKHVGYMPSWSGDVNAVQYSKLTHINYAFVMPRADGTVPAVPDGGKLRSLVSQGHANGVQILISVGGWNNGDDSAIESMAAQAATRSTFVSNMIGIVQEYDLDGVDMDWEFPDPGASGDNYTALMRELSDALHSRGKLLTAAVVSGSSTAHGVQPAVFGYVDFLNIMLYDGGDPHANYDWAIANVNEWKERGLPTSKTVLGVPFYARPMTWSDDTHYTYAQLVAMDPSNAQRDCTEVNGSRWCYNGIPTVQRKAQWALENAGGMMHWELSQDAAGATSLVSAIDDVIRGATPGPAASSIVGIDAKCVDVYWGRTENGTPVQLHTCNGTAAQSWTDDGTGALSALGKCLDVRAGWTESGTEVRLWRCNNTGAQGWQPQPDGTIRNPQSGKCLDAANASSANGTRLIIWDCHGAANQRWQLG